MADFEEIAKGQRRKLTLRKPPNLEGITRKREADRWLAPEKFYCLRKTAAIMA
jgi:hypothetical protein